MGKHDLKGYKLLELNSPSMSSAKTLKEEKYDKLRTQRCQ